MSGINAEQYGVLMRPIRTSRIAKRSQGGKQLSYLESYDVRAHLIRIFGFGNFDVEVDSEEFIGTREYESTGQTPKPMVEVMWKAGVRLTLRTAPTTWGLASTIAVYRECAVGSASGPANMLGEHHDNALKTAASDALKRCAINLGSQFGLSLYDNGSTREIIRSTVVVPEGVQQQEEQQEPDQKKDDRLEQSLGAQVNPTEEGERTQEGGEVSTGNSESEDGQS